MPGRVPDGLRAREARAPRRGERRVLHRGNQLRLTTLLGGTPVARLIRTANARGVTIGGTSAGVSILSEHMIAAGDEGSTGLPESALPVRTNELEAVQCALEWARPGDVLALPVHSAAARTAVLELLAPGPGAGR